MGHTISTMMAYQDHIIPITVCIGASLSSAHSKRGGQLYTQKKKARMRSGWLYFMLFNRLCIPGRFIPLFYTLHFQSPFHIGIILGVSSLSGLFSTPFICHHADSSGRRHRVLIFSQIIATIFFITQAFSFLDVLKPWRFALLLFAGSVAAAFSQPAYAIVTSIVLDRLAHQYSEEEAPLLFGKERLWGAVSWAGGSAILGIILDVVGGGTKAAFAIYTIFGLVSVMFVIFVLLDDKHSHGEFNGHEEEEKSQGEVPTKIKVDVVNVRKSLAGQYKDDDESSGDLENIAIIRMEEIKSQKFEHNDDADTIEEEEIKTYAFTSKPQLTNIDENEKYLSLVRAIHPVICSGGLWTLLFFNLVFWLGVGMSVIENLLFIFFRDDLKASYSLCGLSVVITVIFEVPLFAISDSMIHAIGAPCLMVIGAISYVIRVAGYSFVTSAWHIIFLEPLHGITFAAVHTASVAIVAKRAANRKYRATAQAVLEFVTGVGIVVGTIGGGFVIQAVGNRAMYRGCAVLVFGAVFAFAAADVMIKTTDVTDEIKENISLKMMNKGTADDEQGDSSDASSSSIILPLRDNHVIEV